MTIVTFATVLTVATVVTVVTVGTVVTVVTRNCVTKTTLNYSKYLIGKFQHFAQWGDKQQKKPILNIQLPSF